MVRIIRIAGALIAFFVITDFVAASHGGDAGGSGQESGHRRNLRIGQFPGRARG